MKKIFVTLVLLIILVGCGNKKFYLDEEHYEKGVITSITRDELNKLEKDKKNFKDKKFLSYYITSYCKYNIKYRYIIYNFN